MASFGEQLLELLVYAVALYFFWDVLRNPDGPQGRKREPWVREIHG